MVRGSCPRSAYRCFLACDKTDGLPTGLCWFDKIVIIQLISVHNVFLQIFIQTTNFEFRKHLLPFGRIFEVKICQVSINATIYLVNDKQCPVFLVYTVD